MSKRDGEGCCCLLLVLGALYILGSIDFGKLAYWFYLILLLCILGAILIAVLDRQDRKRREERVRALEVDDVDHMTGREFEVYLKQLLQFLGYHVTSTKSTGDLGVDLVATKGSDKYAIQAKRLTTNVSRRAVSDAVAGMHHYGCNKSMVITNSYYTKGARELAQSTNCQLIDRDQLVYWMQLWQKQRDSSSN
jgi:HJR/Mrr/RecB family endonuclease